MNELNNINISGVGTVTGGEYNKISLSGSTKIIADTKANKFSASGSCKSLANLEGDFINISGSMKSEGGLISSNIMDISGTTKVGFIKGASVKISGAAKINEDANFDIMRVSGSLNVNGSCEGREFKSSAKVVIEKLLSADIVDMKIEGESRIGEIGGEKITVKRGMGFLGFSLFNIIRKELTCGLIEGDEIYLENTNCKIVRGKNVVIGTGCSIEKVEYSGTFNCENKNSVKEVVCIK